MPVAPWSRSRSHPIFRRAWRRNFPSSSGLILGADGRMLVETVEGCYFAFRRRLRSIEHLTTCTCRACQQIPGLQLKLVAHHGEYVVHEVAGSRELVGNDVVLLHRLLKNTVTKTT